MKQGKSLKEAKAERANRKRKARKRKRIIFLLIEILIFVVLLGIGFVMSKYGKFQLNPFSDNDVLINDGVEQEEYTTIALFGGDSREGQLEDNTHADTMMLVSIHNKTKEVRIVSVYRDLLTLQKDNVVKKANSAYFEGGSLNAINMLNQNFDLDIEDYITIDFNALVDIVDMLGGIEVNLTDVEADVFNEYVNGVAAEVGKKGQFIEPGLQTLDGVGALTYARIRKNVGGDYARTERQRHVIQELAKKAKETDLATINDIIDEVFSQISTSFTLKEMISLAAGVLQYEIKDTSGFPFEYTDGSVQGIGSVVIPLGMVENVEELHAFLYPKSDYKASETVKEIAQEIETLTGYTREDYKAVEDTTDNAPQNATESD